MVSRHQYASDSISTKHRVVRIDIGTPTYMRAPGESSGSFALESAIDELAAKKESLNTFSHGAQEALTEFADKAEDIAGRSKDAISGILGGLEGGFEKFFKTGVICAAAR